MLSLAVFNLERSVDERHLRLVFSQFGEVSGVRFAPAMSPSQRIAIVEMTNDEAARFAGNRLNGANLRGVPIKVEAHVAS